MLILGMMETAIVAVTFGATLIDGLLDMASDSLGSFFLVKSLDQYDGDMTECRKIMHFTSNFDIMKLTIREGR